MNANERPFDTWKYSVCKLLLFLLIFSSPFHVLYFNIEGLPINITFFRVVFILSALLSLFIFKKKIRVNRNLLFLASCFVATYTISWLRAESSFKEYANFKILTIYLFFLVVILICELVRNERLFWFALKSTIFTCFIVCLFNIINYLLITFYSFNLLNYADSGMGEYNFLSRSDLYIRLPGPFFDANIFGIYILFSIVIYLYFVNNTVIKHKTPLKFAYYFMIVNLVLTLSRSCFVLFVVDISVIYLFIENKPWLRSEYLGKIITTLFLLAIPFMFFFDDIVAITYQRVIASGVQERVDRAEVGINTFLKSPVIGNGMCKYGNPIYKFVDSYNDAPTTHSLYIDMLADIGLFGSFYFIVFVVLLRAKLLKKFYSTNNTIYKYMLLSIFNVLIFQVVYSSFFVPAFAVQFGIVVSLLSSDISLQKTEA